ncbi:hypothetical protein OVY01_07785 [Robbsia sp. Bb-Pol-6]|uniref:Transmembrane protein n=1 Tax=Robbsia betulipollinis TaxID=2981849 RepID=A0ABT3ZKS1_9BURK|nr:hypothetical protein [Robbsia betulipollinis]MCY0387133.1 hypothetical protein [Robbsia betulipollinis]
MPRFSFSFPRRAAATTLTVALTVALGACSPRYDWRTLDDDTGRYSISLPAKPSLDIRDVDIGSGARLPMRMQTASVKDAVFAVGAVVLPDAQPATRQAALDFVTQGIARNVGPDGASRDVQIKGADGRLLPAREWRASGLVPGTKQSRTVIARFVATDTRVYEAVIISEQALPDEEVRQFLDSFKPF